MEKIHKQFVFLAIVLGAVNFLFAGNWEDYVCQGYNTPVVGEGLLHRPLLSSYSPTEFGLGVSCRRVSKFQREKIPTPLVDVVPDNDHKDESKEGCFLDAPVITPSQEMAGALSKFALLGAATEGFRVAETPSPVKRTRLELLLDDLAEEVKKNPKQLKTLLQENPEQMFHLRKLLAGCGDDKRAVVASLEAVQRRKLNSSPNKRRSFHGGTSDLNFIGVQSGQLPRSESLDRVVIGQV